MLEQLSAPAARLYTDSSAAVAYSSALYDDAVGVAGMADTYAVTQFDGLTHDRGDWRRISRFVLDQQSGGWMATAGLFNDSISPFDIVSGTYSGAAVISGGINYAIDNLARLSDRWLTAWAYATHMTVSWRALDMSGAWTEEADITGITDSVHGRPSLSRTAAANVLCFVTPGGVVIWYDVVAKVQVGPVQYLPANVGAWYSAAMGVYVVLDGSNQISIYAATPAPYALSNPSAVGSLIKGRVNTVRTRLTGSNGEPCADEIIEWSLLAGAGDITSAQSETDADGYAETGYLAPLAIPDSPQIQALVRY